FTTDHYERGNRVDFDDVFKEFDLLWRACDSVLKVRDVRRVGIVGEYRITPTKNPSAALMEFTRLAPRGIPAKFQLQFETRMLTTGASGLPDVKTADFWNTIESYYDSELDQEHADSGQITAMLDVQRYYMPLLNGNVPDELRKLKRRYDEVVRGVSERDVIQQLSSQERQAEHVE
ncbi:MAG TPA: hypothetical protein VFV84_14000, partial [Burkholderiales bacterium]|nr:hypothetical protein [Burkholderiales bacterium]